MKIIILSVAMLIGFGASAMAPAADTLSPDIFQTTVAVTFAAGSSDVSNVVVVTTPSTKRLVIQTVSFYRGTGSSGSSASLFLGTTIFNTLTYWAVPEVYSYTGSVPFPAITQSATYYAGAGSTVFINAYRNGDLTYSETMYASISGYYVAKP